MNNYYLYSNCLDICKKYNETLKIIFISSIFIGIDKYFLDEFNFIHIAILSINTALIFVCCFFLLINQSVQDRITNNLNITENLESFLLLISEKHKYFNYVSLYILYLSILVIIF